MTTPLLKSSCLSSNTPKTFAWPTSSTWSCLFISVWPYGGEACKPSYMRSYQMCVSHPRPTWPIICKRRWNPQVVINIYLSYYVLNIYLLYNTVRNRIMDDDIIKLISLTLLLDLLLLFILLSQSLKVSDTCFVYNVFLVHFIFLYSLCYGHQLFIDFCHYSLFLLLLISPFIVCNLYILCVCLFLVFMIQFLWVVEGRCILNKEGDFFGFGKTISICTLLHTIFLSIIIGKKYMTSYN